MKNQEELINLLKKKDLEIAEYILGGNITHGMYSILWFNLLVIISHCFCVENIKTDF